MGFSKVLVRSKNDQYNVLILVIFVKSNFSLKMKSKVLLLG